MVERVHGCLQPPQTNGEKRGRTEAWVSPLDPPPGHGARVFGTPFRRPAKEPKAGSERRSPSSSHTSEDQLLGRLTHYQSESAEGNIYHQFSRVFFYRRI